MHIVFVYIYIMTIKPKKRIRTVNLNVDVDERLVVVCERLGSNVNAYLINAIGQQLVRDEAQLNTVNSMVSAMSNTFEKVMTDAFSNMVVDEAIEGIKEDNLIIPKSKSKAIKNKKP